MDNKLKLTLAREYALKFLYHLQLSEYKDQKETLENGGELDIDLDQEIRVFHESYQEEDKEHPDNFLDNNSLYFAKNLIQNSLTNYKELIELIQNHTKGWKKENINKIDLTILLVATAEMKFLKDTPKKVVINEAINMAKKFGKEESFSFVNGVLDSILTKELND